MSQGSKPRSTEFPREGNKVAHWEYKIHFGSDRGCGWSLQPEPITPLSMPL